ncbi:hypothetical protein D3C71_1509060 [compost metagenome]
MAAREWPPTPETRRRRTPARCRSCSWSAGWRRSATSRPGAARRTSAATITTATSWTRRQSLGLRTRAWVRSSPTWWRQRSTQCWAWRPRPGRIGGSAETMTSTRTSPRRSRPVCTKPSARRRPIAPHPRPMPPKSRQVSAWSRCPGAATRSIIPTGWRTSTVRRCSGIGAAAPWTGAMRATWCVARISMLTISAPSSRSIAKSSRPPAAARTGRTT